MFWENRTVRYLMAGVTWLNRPWVLEVKLEGEDWFEPALNIHTPLYPSLIPFFYLLLLKSVAKKSVLRYKKYWVSIPPLPPIYAYVWWEEQRRHILLLVNPTYSYIYTLVPSCNKRFTWFNGKQLFSMKRTVFRDVTPCDVVRYVPTFPRNLLHSRFTLMAYSVSSSEMSLSTRMHGITFKKMILFIVTPREH